MASRTYYCTINSDNTIGDRTYTVTSRSAIKAAEKYGRAESNETITIRTFSGQILSRAKWDCQSKRYINVTF